MELVKSAHKLIDIGSIPKNWKVVTIGEISTRIGDGIHSTPNYSSAGSYYFINGNNLKNGRIFIDEETKKVDEIEFKKHERNLNSQTILLSINGTIGNVAFYNNEPVVLGKSAAYINVKNKYSKYYLYYKIQTKSVQLFFNNNLTGSTIKNLGLNTIRQTPISLPKSYGEQKAVATALSDTDELIYNLKQLVAKKKAIKQGAMQQLLTPDESWSTTSLVELAENKKHLFDDGDWVESEHIIDSGIRLIQTGNIGIGKFLDKDNKKFITESSFNKLKCKEVFAGDLLICRLAEPAGRACVMPKIDEHKLITSVDVSVFRADKNKVSREFLSQLFTTIEWFQKVTEKVGGTTHKRISRGALGKISISLPDIEKQNKISKILSDMDNEIDAIEQKKSKYEQIKQGMMQELLTGKTRLV